MTEIQVGISGTLRELADAASQWKRYVRNTLRELCTERIFQVGCSGRARHSARVFSVP